MRDKWGIGPKFHEYLNLNFRMVTPQYVFIALLSVVGLGAAGYLILFSALAKLYSTTLYHRQACLYQSVPVSSFETVLAKTAVGTCGFLLPVLGTAAAELVLSFLSSMSSMSSGQNPQFAFYDRLGSMGLALHMEVGVVLYFLAPVMQGILICGIALFALAVGNRVRENRDKKPNVTTALLVAAGLLALCYGVSWVLDQMTFLTPLAMQLAGLALETAGAAFMFWLNVRALECWYSI